MRVAALLYLLVCSALPQFKTTVPLVLTPTTVSDSKGRYVDGLTPEDLILTDNKVPQSIQIEWTAYPISLVVATRASANSGAVIDKLGRSGILFTQLLATDSGETALISFSDQVRVHQDFTSNSDDITDALRMLRIEGDNVKDRRDLHVRTRGGLPVAAIEQLTTQVADS